MLWYTTGEGVDPVVMQEVAKMVAQSCSTCSKAMRAEGIKVQPGPPQQVAHAFAMHLSTADRTL